MTEDEFDQQQYIRPRDPAPRRRPGPNEDDILADDGMFIGRQDADPINDPAVDIFYLLDSLEELVSVSKRVPLSGRVMVDDNAFLSLVDQLRIAVPNEIKQAQRVIRERKTIIEEAHGEAVRITDAARQQAEHSVSDAGILAAARMKGEQILESAERNKDRAKGQIDAYALEQFDRVDEAMRRAMAIIEETLSDAQFELQEAKANVGLQ